MLLMRIHRKNITLPCNGGSHVTIATSTKLLEIKSEVDRSSGGVIETNGY